MPSANASARASASTSARARTERDCEGEGEGEGKGKAKARARARARAKRKTRMVLRSLRPKRESNHPIWKSSIRCWRAAMKIYVFSVKWTFKPKNPPVADEFPSLVSGRVWLVKSISSKWSTGRV